MVEYNSRPVHTSRHDIPGVQRVDRKAQHCRFVRFQHPLDLSLSNCLASGLTGVGMRHTSPVL